MILGTNNIRVCSAHSKNILELMAKAFDIIYRYWEHFMYEKEKSRSGNI